MVKVAIVEDEAAIASMYETELKNADFDIGVAGNGKTGLVLCEKMKPDSVLLDLMMPEMDGKEMLHRLRETDWGNHIIVIILTNLSQNEASLDLRLLKVEKYIVKAHSTPRQVVEEVEAALRRHGKLS